jgi:hypothetical protein
MKNETSKPTKTGNNANLLLPAVIKIQALSKKNEQTDGYSLGDILLLEKYEKELLHHGFKNEQLVELSPSYYGR